MSGIVISLNIHKFEIMPDRHKKKKTDYIWTRQTLIFLYISIVHVPL